MLKQEGYDLIGAALEVYNELGGGLLEEIYQQSLEFELKLRNIPFDSKRQLDVYYKSNKLNKAYIPDLIVYDKIIVELKAVSSILPEHEAQLINYLKITKLEVGYLINFGNTEKLEWKRYILTNH
ncbi:MAG: GxxExxY protein [Lentisphaerota bacterium]